MKHLIPCLLSLVLALVPVSTSAQQFGFPLVGTGGGGSLPLPLSIGNGGTGLTSAGNVADVLVSDGSAYVATPGNLRYFSKVISSAEIQTMRATPVPLIPAPGADKVIWVNTIVLGTSTGTAYTSGGPQGVRYVGTSTFVTGANNINVLLLTGASNKLGFISSCGASGATGPVTFASLANDGLEYVNKGASEFATGTTTLKVEILYQIIDRI